MVAVFQGDDVSVIRQLDDNWLEGRIGGKQGIFPFNYVDIINEPETPLMTPQLTPRSSYACTPRTGRSSSVKYILFIVIAIAGEYYRIGTHPGKPGKYCNLIIRIPGFEYTEILSKENLDYEPIFGAVFLPCLYL